VSPQWAIGAQIATWRFLWRNDHLPAATEHPDAETREAIRRILSDAGARVTTLRGLVASLGYAAEDDIRIALRDAARHLLTDAGFGLHVALLTEAAGGTMAPEFLSALSQIAEPATAGEIVEYILLPYGIPKSSAEWRTELIRRAGRSKTAEYRSTTFVIRTPIKGLSVQRAQDVLERVAAAACFARHDTTYVRVRFEGNGKAVAYWDEHAKVGVVKVDDEIEDLESFSPRWPDWSVRVDELESQLADLSPAKQSA